MENDIYALLASLPNEEQAQQLSHEELLKAYCAHYRFTCQLAQAVVTMQTQLALLQKKVEQLQEENNELRRKLNVNSDTAGIPPSQDPLRNERRAAKEKEKEEKEKGPKGDDSPPPDGKGTPSGASKGETESKVGGKKGHPGHRQRMVQPDEVTEVFPTLCPCGCTEFDELTPFYTHQHFELPQILVLAKHFLLHKGVCTQCGKEVRAKPPAEYSTGYGPNFSAFAVHLSALGVGRRGIVELFTDQGFFKTSHGEGIPLSLGGLNKIFKRSSEALAPHHAKIAEIARVAPINNIDETCWRRFGPYGRSKEWVWVMASPGLVTFFNIHSNRNRAAFEELIGDWTGFLISDDYALYRSWPAERRQACLAHLLRAAKKVSMDPVAEIAKGGLRLYKELCRLTKTDKKTLTEGEWGALQMRLKGLINKFKDQKDVLGTLAARLDNDWPSLHTFLRVEDVEGTNNYGERSLRGVVRKRKIAGGSTSEYGVRWAERVLTFWQTCKVQGWSFFDHLRTVMSNFLKGEPQDLTIYDPVLRLAQEARTRLGLDEPVPDPA